MEEKRRLVEVELRVEVRDREGRVVGVRRCRSDLILDNFRDFLAGVLIPFESLPYGAARYASIVDTGGVARNTPIWANDENPSGQGLTFTGASRSPSWPIGVTLAVGTSTTAPTRGDYKLGAEVAYGVPTVTVGADYISWAVSIVLETAADIAEASLRCVFQHAFLATTSYSSVQLFRDTFTAISVPAGGTISVTYTLSL